MARQRLPGGLLAGARDLDCHRGCFITTNAQRSHATALLASRDFAGIACLISDIGMSVINGYELQRIVYDIRPEMAVIFITGDPDWRSGEQSDGLPHYGFFQKPFDCEELLVAVDNALHRHSHR